MKLRILFILVLITCFPVQVTLFCAENRNNSNNKITRQTLEELIKEGSAKYDKTMTEKYPNTPDGTRSIKENGKEKIYMVLEGRWFLLVDSEK